MPTQRLFFIVLIASLAVALLPALWPQLDLAVSGYFIQTRADLHTSDWLWIELVNAYTPDLFRGTAIVLLACWIGIGLVRRLRRTALALAFIGLSLLLGPGLATWAVKEHQQRARPMDVIEFGGQRQFTPALQPAQQCNDNCAFVSGHAACGFFFASLMLLDPRRRGWWIGAGVVGGLAVSLARISVGAHWLSDTLWTFPITLIVSWIVWRLLALIYRDVMPAEPDYARHV